MGNQLLEQEQMLECKMEDFPVVVKEVDEDKLTETAGYSR